MYLKLQYCVSCAIHGKIVRYVKAETNLGRTSERIRIAGLTILSQCPFPRGSSQPCSTTTRSIQQGWQEGQPKPGRCQDHSGIRCCRMGWAFWLDHGKPDGVVLDSTQTTNCMIVITTFGVFDCGCDACIEICCRKPRCPLAASHNRKPLRYRDMFRHNGSFHTRWYITCCPWLYSLLVTSTVCTFAASLRHVLHRDYSWIVESPYIFSVAVKPMLGDRCVTVTTTSKDYHHRISPRTLSST